MFRRRIGALLAVAVAAVTLQLPGLAPAQAVQSSQPTVVSAVPSASTPHAVNGRVYSITQVGNTIVMGGSFTQVQPPDRSVTYALPWVVAFDATTGAVNTAFAPGLDAQVEAVYPGPTPGTVYVGGDFANVKGVRAKGLVLLNLSDGSRVTTFKTPVMNGVVQTVKKVGSRLFVGGTFTTFGGVARGGLATVGATTGLVDSFLTSAVTVNHNWTSTNGAQKAAVGVNKLDVTPDGTRLVGIGNFKVVDGLARDQVAMWDLTGATAVVRPDWQTHGYEPACYSFAYDSYVRDVDFSPDGSYFAIASTGGGNNTLCDSTARFETAGTGTDIQPTWVAYAGGDSLLSVAITGSVVYTGGHQRWLNNPDGNDNPGGGAVPRPGLAALDPRTGMPLAWNPGRNPRGAGAYSLFASPTGLWVGSDTDYIGNRRYLRSKIAFFPLAGGQAVASDAVATLPGGVNLGGIQTPGSTNVLYRVNAGGPAVQSIDSGPDWSGDTGSSPLHNDGSNTAGWNPVPNVDATVPASTPRSVFDSERWDPGSKGDGGELAWSFPVPAGQQVQVRVYLANRCGCTSAVGSRVFDVNVEGAPLADNLDLVAAAGDQTGTMRAVNVTSDGTINVDFGHETENPLVNGIEIVRTDVPAPSPGSASPLVRRDFNGTTAGQALPVDSTFDWGSVRGATLIGTTLFYGRTDSNLYKRTYSGQSFGPETLVDPYNDPLWSTVDTGSGQTFRGTKPTFYGEITNLTSMFYDGNGRLYYTLYGQSGLFYRAFSPDSGIVHNRRQQVAGSLPDVTGAFAAGGFLYYATRADGNLSKVALTSAGISGTPVVVSGPGLDGIDWRARVLFLGAANPANVAPTARATVSCTGLTCQVDGTTSSDPDGTIASYAWSFGDGGTAGTPTATHTYAAGGSYPVTLTVTDNRGGTASTTVTAAPHVNQPPTAAMTQSCSALLCNVNGSGSSDPDGSIASYAWDFGDGSTATGATASHRYAAAGSYQLSLQVTDNEGATGSTTTTLAVTTTPASALAFRAQTGVNTNSAAPAVTVPASVQTGDALVLAVTSSASTTHALPAGWTEVPGSRRLQGSVLSTVWQKVATASDAGSGVAVTLSTATKVDVRLVAYSGTATTTPVSAVSTSDSALTTNHLAPASNVTTAGSYVLRYWADKSSTTTSWTPPGGLTVRSSAIGTGTGYVSSLLVDGGLSVPAGPVAGAVATTNATSKGVGITLVLAPAP